MCSVGISVCCKCSMIDLMPNSESTKYVHELTYILLHELTLFAHRLGVTCTAGILVQSASQPRGCS